MWLRPYDHDAPAVVFATTRLIRCTNGTGAAIAPAPCGRRPIHPLTARSAHRHLVQEWSRFYYLNGGAEIARVEAPDWLADDPELLAVSHAMLVKQCQLGLGYPVAVSEAHEQAGITGHDREEFRRPTLMLLEQRGLPTPESVKSFSKRRPWV